MIQAGANSAKPCTSGGARADAAIGGSRRPVTIPEHLGGYSGATAFNAQVLVEFFGGVAGPKFTSLARLMSQPVARWCTSRDLGLRDLGLGHRNASATERSYSLSGVVHWGVHQ
jgi:hypothetical protein